MQLAIINFDIDQPIKPTIDDMQQGQLWYVRRDRITTSNVLVAICVSDKFLMIGEGCCHSISYQAFSDNFVPIRPLKSGDRIEIVV